MAAQNFQVIPALGYGAEAKEIFENLNNESDRGVLLIGADAIESLLMELIVAGLPNHCSVEERASLVKSFHVGGRSKLAQCLGLLNENECEQLKLLRKLRNAVAHHFKTFSLDEKEVAANVAQLSPGLPAGILSQSTSPSRQHFVIFVAMFIATLTGKLAAARKMPQVPIVGAKVDRA